MAAVEKQKGPRSPARPGLRRSPRRTVPRHSLADEVRDLARSGKHAQAIEVATAALARAGVAASDRIELLDLRAESFIAQGDTDAALADAESMLDIAQRARKPGFVAQALNRRALVEIRTGRSRLAVETADAALAAARRAKAPALEGIALLRLAESQFRVAQERPGREVGDTGGAAVEGARPAAIRGARDVVHRRGAQRAGPPRRIRPRCAPRPDARATQRRRLRRGRCDQPPDVPRARHREAQGPAAAVAPGIRGRWLSRTPRGDHPQPRPSLSSSSGSTAARAGCCSRRRQCIGARARWEPASPRHCGCSAEPSTRSATSTGRRPNLAEAVDRMEAAGGELAPIHRPLTYGWLAVWEKDPAAAVPLFERAAGYLRDKDHVAIEMLTLTGLSEAHLALGHDAAALEASGAGRGAASRAQVRRDRGREPDVGVVAAPRVAPRQRQDARRHGARSPPRTVSSWPDKQAHRRGTAPQLSQQDRATTARS